MKKNIVVISAPSGGGKTVVVNFILKEFSNFSFSISSTTRTMRNGESEGAQYYFLDKTTFEDKIKNNEFAEYEMIFGNYYGTLKSEINRIHSLNKIPLFDLDVKGAYSLREQYSDETLLIFLKPPSIDILAERLRSRNTETEEQIRKRLERAESEIEIGSNFDFVITNDTLSNTLTDIKFIIEKYVCTTNN